MNTPTSAFVPATPSRMRCAALGLVLGLVSVSTLAQGVYRIVGPDGRVSFSDQPPPAATARPAASGPTGAAANSNPQLPFELRQVVSRYPVLLYTSSECAPCNSGRNLLNARGIPYSEKTISTSEDAEALRRLSGQTSLPFLTIGSQQIRGYSDSEWTQFLDAAGYPKQSALPSGYRRAAATPLVAVQAEAPTPAAPAAPAASAPRADTPAAVPVAPPASNPAGIRF
ncbi:MAG: glutaredoxin family protein [Hydrogenophaga sp.]|uniref:glutaredoxin family protein n=1 Tax=Hydrogenophaga sp. TaxID=1904254 RepID=UPI00262CF7F0|nr:glutaredoxin family protein [Hydrogenophaga sp.]MDM7942609.1 glutaredoxin family protein [Hydrogenophaga sp.]